MNEEVFFEIIKKPEFLKPRLKVKHLKNLC